MLKMVRQGEAAQLMGGEPLLEKAAARGSVLMPNFCMRNCKL